MEKNDLNIELLIRAVRMGALARPIRDIVKDLSSDEITYRCFMKCYTAGLELFRKKNRKG